MALNECYPKYEPGQDITGHANEALIGRRCVTIVADKQGAEAVTDDTSGGNIVVGVAKPTVNLGRIVGVAGFNAAQGDKPKIVRGTGKVVPIESGAAIAAFAEVEVDALGRVVPLGTTANIRACGRAWRSCSAAGQFPLIELY